MTDANVSKPTSPATSVARENVSTIEPDALESLLGPMSADDCACVLRSAELCLRTLGFELQTVSLRETLQAAPVRTTVYMAPEDDALGRRDCIAAQISGGRVWFKVASTEVQDLSLGFYMYAKHEFATLGQALIHLARAGVL